MKLDRTEHLSEEEMDEVLMGLAGSDVERHLASCDACRGTLAQFRVDVVGLEQASRAWNEARANSMPALRANTTKTGIRRFGIAAMGVACALVLMLGLLIGKGVQVGHRTPSAVADSSVAEDGSPIRGGELNQDNALMVAINKETGPIPSPLDAYHRSTMISSEGSKQGERATR